MPPADSYCVEGTVDAVAPVPWAFAPTCRKKQAWTLNSALLTLGLFLWCSMNDAGTQRKNTAPALLGVYDLVERKTY